MPEIVDDDIYLARGSGEVQLDTGDARDLADRVALDADGFTRILESISGLRVRMTYTASERRKRDGQPPAAPPRLKPNKTVAPAAPIEAPPAGNDGPGPQAAPDIAAPPEAVVVIRSKPQGSAPLVKAEDPTPIVYDQLNPIPIDDILALLAAPPANFDDFVDRLKKNQPQPGEPHPTHARPAPKTAATDADPVDLFSGCFTLQATDLAVPTAFIPVCMSRSYRSGRPYFGPFGYGWDHRYNVFLRELNDGRFALWSGQLQEQHFKNTGAAFEPEPGLLATLERGSAPGAFVVGFSGGTQWVFDRPGGWSDTERIPLVEIRDRHGNTVALRYGAGDRLVSVLDDAGRGLLFHYGSCDLLERVTDHAGLREVRYEHDPEIEHLVRVVLPATLQYPDGLRTHYEYATYNPHPAMRHNILRVIDADERLMVENEYGSPDAGWEFNTVVRQRVGGFDYQFGYEQIQFVEPDDDHVDVLATRTVVRRPDGSLHTYTFNFRGELLDHRFRLVRDGSFRVVAAQWRYDVQGNLIESTGPDGLRKIRQFDAANADPRARANLLQMQLGAPLSSLIPGRIVFEADHEPRFQLPRETRDESGAATRFRYDFDVAPFGSTGRLLEVVQAPVTLADGSTQHSSVTFEHNARGQMTAVTTAEGRRTEYEFIATGSLQGFASAVVLDRTGANLVTAIGYDAFGFPGTAEAPGARKTSFLHNALGQLEEITSPMVDAQVARIRRWFDDSGAVVRLERPAGSFTGLLSGTAIVDEYERDEAGHPHRTLVASNTGDRQEWLHRVDHEGRHVATWDPLGTRTDRVYGEDGALLSQTAAAGEPQAQTVRCFYDRAGRLLRQVDAALGETTLAYDLWGRPRQITLPSGAVRTLVFGDDDRLLEERLEDVVGAALQLRQRQTSAYDERGRLVAATQFAFDADPTTAVALTTHHGHDRDDRLRDVTLPRGGRLLYGFDSCGRLSETTDVRGNLRRFVYGPAGDLAEQVTLETDGGVTRSVSQTFVHDARGRWVSSTCLDAHAERRYDDRNLPVEHTAPSGVTRHRQFDALGRQVMTVVDPAGLALTSRHERDLLGRLTRHVDPMGRATQWAHDVLGRETLLTLPDGSAWASSFDDPWVTHQHTPAGNAVTHARADASGRLVTITASAAPGQAAVPATELHFDGLGRLARAEAGGDTVERAYDSFGRLTRETTRGETVSMRYDDLTGAVDLVYPDGRRERTEHNPAGQPTRVSLVAPGSLGGMAGEVLMEVTYATSGRPLRVDHANGVQEHLAHDELGRPVSIEYRHGGTLLSACRTRYDEHGQRALVQYQGPVARNLLHRFDGAGRLVETRTGFALPALPADVTVAAMAADVAAARAAAATAPGVSHLLDDADARTAANGFNGDATATAFTLGVDHRIAAVGADPVLSTLDGQRTRDALHDFQLDAFNRVTQVRDRATSALRAELRYDALSRVSAGAIDGQPFERWFAEGTQVHERVGAAAGVRQHLQHVLRGTPVCATDASGRAFTHLDDGLSAMCITDAAGTVVERHRYGVDGACAAFAADGFTPLLSPAAGAFWRGMPGLGATGLYRTPTRLYDAATGVFTSRDPLLYADSASPYVFGGQNPVDFADPSGLAKTPIATHGYSISPPPPISGNNDTLLVRQGDWMNLYESSRQEAKKAHPDAAKVYTGLLISPIALLEELARGLLNTPHSVVNSGTHGGEHIARAYAWAEQGEPAEAVAETLEAVASFSLGFLDLAFLGEAGAVPKVPKAPKVFRPTATAPAAVPAALPEVVVNFDPVFQASAADANWYRFVVEQLQAHQGGSLQRVLGSGEKRLASDAGMRRRARRELESLGHDISELQAGHPADSIINPFAREGQVGSTYYFMEGRVNGEFGRQFSQQLNMLGVQKGQRFIVRFIGPWPDFALHPPMAPLASSPGLLP
jgi:RHS repeat-associated protein